MADHDQLFKTTFEQLPEAASLLSRCLPPEVAAAINWHTLENISPEFNAQDLVRRQSDLVFRVNASGHDARLVVLLEHQSSVDDAMPLRAQGYVTRIWEKHWKDKPGSQLPLVLPVVVYQGPTPWSAPTRLVQMMAPYEGTGLAPFLPNFHFVLVDLSRLSDSELRARALTPVATLTIVVLTRCRNVEHPERVLEGWFDQMLRVANGAHGVNALRAVGTYLVRASPGPPDELQLLFERLGNTGKEAFVTMAEIMEQRALAKGLQQGHLQGLQQGHLQGLQQGLHRGMADTLLRQLTRKFGVIPDEVRTRVETAANDQLARWTEQVLDATTLNEALRT